MEIFGLSWEENQRAVQAGLKAQEGFQDKILRAELDASPVFAPPPAPYEVETPVCVNSIRREE